MRVSSAAAIQLPPPRVTSNNSIEECLRARRTCRLFSGAPALLSDAAQLLWAAQGVTGFCGLRTAPSAGAVYPLVTYLIAMNVSGLKAGAYIYNPDDHQIALHKAGSLRAKLLKSVFDQDEVESAPLGILLCALYRRSRRDFGEMGVRLADMEAGHAGQNVLLQAPALAFGAIGMGRMDSGAMRRALDIPEAEEPLYLLLAGAR